MRVGEEVIVKFFKLIQQVSKKGKKCSEEVDIKCFKCEKVVIGAYFKSLERKMLYQAGDIVYVCIKCAIEEGIINQNKYVEEVRGIWVAIDKNAKQAEIKGKRFENVIKKEKETDKY